MYSSFTIRGQKKKRIDDFFIKECLQLFDLISIKLCWEKTIHLFSNKFEIVDESVIFAHKKWIFSIWKNKKWKILWIKKRSLNGFFFLLQIANVYSSKHQETNPSILSVKISTVFFFLLLLNLNDLFVFNIYCVGCTTIIFFDWREKLFKLFTFVIRTKQEQEKRAFKR